MNSGVFYTFIHVTQAFLSFDLIQHPKTVVIANGSADIRVCRTDRNVCATKGEGYF